ncbi:MAG: metal-dependent phosphohydrolase, partial [Treponema sp.]|nr:metal-dependent phosphohydrolase [Treponema sp.]
MAAKETVIPLSKVLISPDSKSINKKYIDIILEEEVPVLCINRSAQKKRLMPFKVLYDNNENFWQKNDSWEYYFTSEGFNTIKEKSIVKLGAWDLERLPVVQPAASQLAKKDDDIEELEAASESEIEAGFGREYKSFAGMSTAEKVDYLNNNKKRLNEMIAAKPRDEAEVAKALVDTTKDAALINHAVLEDAIYLADDEAKKVTQDIVDSTHEMVKSSAQLISENIFSNSLMDTLVKKSNGTIIQHMTRVYLNGISFLTFYNNLVSTSSAIQKMRINFAAKYKKFYHALLPHLEFDNIILERVFYGGMRAVPPDLYFKWAVDFLIHDIGKAAAVEYHEGESKYNRQIVIDHVKQGYKSIMSKTNYPMEASLITGYHHEYYGDPEGYGYFRAYLTQYRKNNPDAKTDYCITYDLEPILDYQALA